MKLAVGVLGCSFAVLLTALALAPAAATSPQESATTTVPAADAGWPAGPGLSLIQERCSACHSPTIVKTERHDAAGWGAIVNTMVDRGARASDAEQHTIRDYLAKNFGPTAKTGK